MINQKRIDGLLKYMAELGQQQMIIRNPLLIKYLLGYAPRGGDRATILYVSQTNGIKLIANYLTTWPKGLEDEIEIVTHGDQDSVAEEIAKYTLKDVPLAVDMEYPAKWLIPLRDYNAATDYVLGDRAMNLQRAHKDEEEMQLLREASRMNDRVMAKARGLFYDGVTEIEISRKLSAMFAEEGADGPGWALVAFGANSCEVHHHADNTPLKPGDAILIDMGAPRKGYHSDMTRTFFWKSVSDRQREIYELVKTANIEAEKATKPGMTCREVDKVARDIISAPGYGEYFTHRLGHYIGIELHDPGDIAFYNSDPVEPTMAFSCEPGIYLPGEFGVRIEDLVIVTEDGVEILNSDNKELEILGLE